MTEDTPDIPRKRRWVMPVLVISLAANLLIAGIVVGALLSPDGPRNRDGDRRVRGVIGEPFFRALPKEERRALVSDVLQHRAQIRESRESLRQRFDAFLAALRADPFDLDEIERLLGEQRQAAVHRQEIGETLLIKRLVAMTPQQRADYADALEASLKKFKRR